MDNSNPVPSQPPSNPTPQPVSSANVFIPTNPGQVSSSPSPKSSFNISISTVKYLSAAGLVLMLSIGGGMYALSLRNSSNSLQRTLTDRNKEIAQYLDEEPADTGIEIVGKAQATYENPFEEETSYENPFDEYENPFAD